MANPFAPSHIGQRMVGGLVALGVIALLAAAFEWSGILLRSEPERVSCAQMLEGPLPRQVVATGCSLDLAHAFVLYEANEPVAYVPLVGRPTHPSEVEVVLVSREDAMVAQVLEEGRPAVAEDVELRGGRWTFDPEGERLERLQGFHEGIARHTQYLLHERGPDRSLAIISSVAAGVFLVPGLLGLVLRRRRQG